MGQIYAHKHTYICLDIHISISVDTFNSTFQLFSIKYKKKNLNEIFCTYIFFI